MLILGRLFFDWFNYFILDCTCAQFRKAWFTEHIYGDGLVSCRPRSVGRTVPLEKIKTEEVRKIIKKLEYVLNKYNSLGMSAPQIGVNMRIFVMRLTINQIAKVPKDTVKHRGMEEVPFSVFINPTLKVLNYVKLVHTEGCESVQGYEAEVPRYKQVEVTGYNEEGILTTRNYENWAARIAQHEIEHLDGKMYVDSMDRKTLSCVCWEEVNMAKGKVVIPFSP